MDIVNGPVFIGGLDRSGKTPLGILLSRHPNLSLTRKTYMWTRFYNRFGDIRQEANFESCLSAMMRHEPIRNLEPDLDQIRKDFWQGDPTYAQLFALFQAQYAQKMGKTRWVDQLAFVEYYADPIFAAYPNARMIHMIRHPLQRLGAALQNRRPKKGKVGVDLARWLESVRLAKRNQQRYPDRYQVIKYEALACNREATLREIMAFIGEEFDPKMLASGGKVLFGEGNGNDSEANESRELETAQAGPVPYTDDWRGFSKEEITFIQSFARAELQGMGYSVFPMELPLRSRLAYLFVDWPVNLAGVGLWKIRKDQRIHTT